MSTYYNPRNFYNYGNYATRITKNTKTDKTQEYESLTDTEKLLYRDDDNYYTLLPYNEYIKRLYKIKLEKLGQDSDVIDTNKYILDPEERERLTRKALEKKGIEREDATGGSRRRRRKHKKSHKKKKSLKKHRKSKRHSKRY